MNGSISISICVPALNEESTIRLVVEDLRLTLSPYLKELEIIIVDDGSSDSTPRLIETLRREGRKIKVIYHKKNEGIGVCYRDALTIASGEYFTWFPADNENLSEELLRCLPYLRYNSAVTTHHRGNDPRPVFRRLLSYIYVWILNKYFNLNLKYYNGLTLFPVRVLRSFPLISRGFVFTAETLIRAIKYGCEVKELSFPLQSRKYGKSKSLTFTSFYQVLKDMIYLFSVK